MKITINKWWKLWLVLCVLAFGALGALFGVFGDSKEFSGSPIPLILTVSANAFGSIACICQLLYEEYLSARKYEQTMLAQVIFFNLESYAHFALILLGWSAIALIPLVGRFRILYATAVIFYGVFYVAQNAHVSSIIRSWKHYAKEQGEGADFPGNRSVAFVAVAQQLLPLNIVFFIVMPSNFLRYSCGTLQGSSNRCPESARQSRR